jgi:HEPN domain-containing protein
MHTSIQHLPSYRQDHLAHAIKIIKEVVFPEKIILYGVFASSENLDLYSDKGMPSLHGSYELLVVTRSLDFRSDHHIQDIVENTCRNKTPLTILVHDIDYVNKQLAEGQCFFYELLQNGILLYDALKTPFADGIPPDFNHTLTLARKDFACWFHRAEVFYGMALFTRVRKERALTLFNLHQAAEQTYQAILLVFTGYKPCTHNLDKLRRFTNRFSLELAALFSRKTSSEDNFFKLLLRAYVDGRYSEEYQITEEELDTLVNRVHSLLHIAERLSHNRFIHLEKLAAIT